MSANTMRDRLSLFCSRIDVPVERVDRRHIERYLAETGQAASTKRGHLSTLRGFFDHLVDVDAIKRNPCTGVKAPKLPPLIPRALTGDQVEAVMGVARLDLRTTVVALLMLQEGLRRGEVAGVQQGDIDWRQQTLAVRGKGAEGGVTAVLPLSEETVRAIRTYIDVERIPRSGPLIRRRVVGQEHEGVTPGFVTGLMTQVFRDAGVKQRAHDGMSAHALRHTAAHDMLDEGATIREVQQALRHRSVMSTEVYLRGHVGDLRRAMSGRSYT